MTELNLFDIDHSEPKNLKPWLKSVFINEEIELHLKAIDLELANSLCLNELLASKIRSASNSLASDEKKLKIYAYLVINLSQALSRGDVCIEISHLYAVEKAHKVLGITRSDIENFLPQFLTVHQIELNTSSELSALSQKNPYDLVINYPLVLMQGRLYFSRYWFYQHQVFFAISRRLVARDDLKVEALNKTLQALFPSQSDSKGQPNWQMLAAANACLNRFSVITGGPGTGKTTTVTRLLAALISQEPTLRIALAAPTGKAAARLVESIMVAKKELVNTFPLAEKIPVTSFTLHRLLGWRPDGFSYHHKKTLPYDLVIVDEASMVDLPVMAQLMESLNINTRLILLGDKDQLASVEAGSVLGDLCDSGVLFNGYHAHGFEVQRAQQLELLCGMQSGFLNAYVEPDAPLMANSLTQLRVSYRFTSDSGIGKLAAAVNAGRYDLVTSSFSEYSDIHFYASLNSSLHVSDGSGSSIINEKQAEQAWQQQVINGYGYYLNAITKGESPETVLELFTRFQVLCALRQGSSGLFSLNERIQTLLQSHGLLKLDSDINSLGQQRWYPGRPVMISRNDYELNLFNGDIGIAMMVSGRQGESKELRACFLSDGKVRQILPTRLPEHETAFAMTVHKSQGSEFTDVALVLPENYSPVISRELIYTAITRSKSSFSLYSNADVLGKGVSGCIERASGLRYLFFGGDK